MPRYDFRCSNCNKVFEVVRTFSQSEEPVSCPDCQGTANRILSNSFTVFSKSYTGWATRVQGTDWPWRTPAGETPAPAEEAGEEAEESAEEARAAEQPINPPALARYAAILEHKLNPDAPEEVSPSKAEESGGAEQQINPPSLARYSGMLEPEPKSEARE